ncbi:FHA domain-containing protein, partial [Agromyces sp. CFH 90414]
AGTPAAPAAPSTPAAPADQWASWAGPAAPVDVDATTVAPPVAPSAVPSQTIPAIPLPPVIPPMPGAAPAPAAPPAAQPAAPAAPAPTPAFSTAPPAEPFATPAPAESFAPAAPAPAADPLDFAVANTVLRDGSGPILGADDDFDDDVESTVVVDRRPRVTWRLVLDDGTELGLTADRVLLGRNPSTADPAEQRLPVPDSTRTLSKTHARLVLADGQWSITDLGSTNGVLVDEGGEERLIDPHDPVPARGRFVLGEVGMRVEMGGGS